MIDFDGVGDGQWQGKESKNWCFVGQVRKKNCVRDGKEIQHRPSLLLGGAVNAGSLLRFSLSLFVLVFKEKQ